MTPIFVKAQVYSRELQSLEGHVAQPIRSAPRDGDEMMIDWQALFRAYSVYDERFLVVVELRTAGCVWAQRLRLGLSIHLFTRSRDLGLEAKDSAEVHETIDRFIDNAERKLKDTGEPVAEWFLHIPR